MKLIILCYFILFQLIFFIRFQFFFKCKHLKKSIRLHNFIGMVKVKAGVSKQEKTAVSSNKPGLRRAGLRGMQSSSAATISITADASSSAEASGNFSALVEEDVDDSEEDFSENESLFSEGVVSSNEDEDSPKRRKVRVQKPKKGVKRRGSPRKKDDLGSALSKNLDGEGWLH